jgi:hypothetical protein
MVKLKVRMDHVQSRGADNAEHSDENNEEKANFNADRRIHAPDSTSRLALRLVGG